MPEQKKQSVKMIITVALGTPPTINVDVQNELHINEEQPLTKYFLERVSEYISGKEATTNAIKKAAQDTLTKRNIH
ncbi:hypothetical protein LLI29_003337 [Morganella morganii]|uniref:hypothetical protein n=1 Tax=Morganella morganii TaxID=582 RepID=UPI001D2AF0BA|nr:hypothetical protein [Morganella morganii]EKU8062251.1 hypothetical protein [Morganella morganii]ELB1287748.1 hypothetical protein [Morganella morganii]